MSAAKLARQRMAATEKQRHELKDLDTEDLATFLRAGDTLTRAEHKRDAAIAAAHKGYSTSADTVRSEQAGALQRIHKRGVTTDAELEALTGLSAGDLRKLLRAPAASTPAKPAARKTPTRAAATDNGATSTPEPTG